MCGRISTANLSPATLKAQFRFDSIPSYLQSYNVAPTLQIPAIRQQDKARTLSSLRWGLIPHWAEEKGTGVSAFNARVETLTQKPFFRDPFKSKRCIIPASGFYEWHKKGDKKQPYYISRADKQPIAFAGLWDAWMDKETGEAIESCSIITVPATHRMAEIHDRMPAVLEAELFDTWLDPEFKEIHLLQDILRALKPDVLEMYPVSTYVSNSRNGGEKCIERS
jgi:putative SOS response-associated peptidase YedK